MSVSSDSNDEGGPVALARSLFGWVCQNCTHVSRFQYPTDAMVRYASAAAARAAGAKEVLRARQAYARERMAYEQRLTENNVPPVPQTDLLGGGFFNDGASASDTPATAAAAPLGAPAAPDFEAMVRNLPSVPQPPDINAGEELTRLQSLFCEMCQSPYIPPPPPCSALTAGRITAGQPQAKLGSAAVDAGSNASDRPDHVQVALKPRLEVLEATLADDVPDDDDEVEDGHDHGDDDGTEDDDEMEGGQAHDGHGDRRHHHHVHGKGCSHSHSHADRPAGAAVRAHLSSLGIDESFMARVLNTTPCCDARGRTEGQAGAGASSNAAVEDDDGEERLVSMRQDLREVAPLTKTLGTALKGQGGWGSFAPLTGYVYDQRMLLHEEAARPESKLRLCGLQLMGAPTPSMPAPPHPERPDRLRAIAQHLVAQGLLQRCVRIGCREVTREEVAAVHNEQLLAVVDGVPALVTEGGGTAVLDGSDTFCNEHTYTAAKLAAGSLVELTEAVCRGTVDRGVALIRPPGHHAEPDRAMGFCLYNNIAVAAAAARNKFGSRRVLIVDWDVHHGNGTEEQFYDDPSVLLISLHRYDRGDFYPGTGHMWRMGDGAGTGYNINIPWEGGGYGDAEYLLAFDEVVMPVAHSFSPDLVMVSCGFDAADGDPLGGCALTPTGYAHMTHRLLSLANGRMVMALEGGYNLHSISRGMEAVLRTMMGCPPPRLVEVPRRIHEANTSAAVASGLVRPKTAPASSDPSGAPAPSSIPSYVRPLDDDDAQYYEEQEDGLAHEYEGMDRDAVLDKLAPKAKAAHILAKVVHRFMPYWPVLKRKYTAYEARVQVAAAEHAAKHGLGAGSANGLMGVGQAIAVSSGSAGAARTSVLASIVKGSSNGGAAKAGEGHEEHEADDYDYDDDEDEDDDGQHGDYDEDDEDEDSSDGDGDGQDRPGYRRAPGCRSGSSSSRSGGSGGQDEDDDDADGHGADGHLGHDEGDEDGHGGNGAGANAAPGARDTRPLRAAMDDDDDGVPHGHASKRARHDDDALDMSQTST